jgi:hypothetical protein
MVSIFLPKSKIPDISPKREVFTALPFEIYEPIRAPKPTRRSPQRLSWRLSA